MYVNSLECCGLLELSKVKNTTIILEIREKIRELKQKSQEGGGARTVLCVTMFNERFLREKLARVGFKKIYEFRQRPGLGNGKLYLHALSW